MKKNTPNLMSLLLLLPVLMLGLAGPAVAVSVVKCDLIEDDHIDWRDLSVIAGNWLADCTTYDCNGADLNDNNMVELADLALFARHWSADPDFVGVWKFIQQQLANSMYALINDPNYVDANYPRSTDENGKWKPRSKGTWGHWACGFWPGALWYLYKETSDQTWKQWAQGWTEPLENNRFRTHDHEAGFTVYRSFGFGYHITAEPGYKPVILDATESLLTRYNPTVGCIRSWNSYTFPVITDGMMMLEMVFWASKNGGDPNWYDMAVSHAVKTMQNNVRPNGSTWQIVDYNPGTGGVIGKYNKQGYSNDSTWSRGQAWGICGFTIAYRETNDPNFLETAKRVADYFIDNLPEDYVPYWDFNAPGIPDEPRDSSASAIAASGLLELSELVPAQQDKERYYNAACNILASLSSPD